MKGNLTQSLILGLVWLNRENPLIEEVSEQFDMVLIDTPPIITVTDAAILAQEVDGAILVLASGEVNKGYRKKLRNSWINWESRPS